MSDPVVKLIDELSQKGWSSERTGGQLKFTRDESIIIGHQEYVTYSVGELSASSEWAPRYWSMMERLNFLLEQIRIFADKDDRRVISSSVRTPAWIEKYAKRAERMNERFESDDEYFEAGEDLGVALDMIAKLIQAVTVANDKLDEVIRDLEEASELGMDNVYVRSVYEKLFDFREQLQSGEFGDGEPK